MIKTINEKKNDFSKWVQTFAGKCTFVDKRWTISYVLTLFLGSAEEYIISQVKKVNKTNEKMRVSTYVKTNCVTGFNAYAHDHVRFVG